LFFSNISAREKAMNQQWIEISLKVPSAAADTVCAVLASLGSTGVREREQVLDTFIVPDADENASEVLDLRAYFPNDEDPRQLVERIEQQLAPLRCAFPSPGWSAATTGQLADGDWAESWKQHFPVFRVGSLIVKPSWEEVDPGDADVVLTIDPGMAFGTGTHATTRLCLEFLVEEFAARSSALKVLDMGTGSGILALAAAAFGAGGVLACDIDAEACRVARENAAANDLDDRIDFTTRSLEDLGTGFDLVLANILAEENVRLASELVRRVAPGGLLVLSGILQEKEHFVREGFSRFGLSGPQVRSRDEWVCLAYRRSD
jgi:ribosomal protein L11 methyltransferase